MIKDVIFFEKEGELIARIGCDIDHHSARSMREKIDDKLFELKPHTLTIDFSAVGFMDSSGLGLILGRCSVAEGIGASVRLTGLTPAVMRIIRLGGLDKIRNLTLVK